MVGEPAKNFHGIGIGPLSKILAVDTKNYPVDSIVNSTSLLIVTQNDYMIKPSPFVQIVERY